MALYAIGDLHLSIDHPEKTMDIYKGWENYINILFDNWNKIVKKDDTVVILGDVSWAVGLKGAKNDFDYINSLNGEKIILKGNHDFWWATKTKMDNFISENNYNMKILHNNHYEYGKYGICGTRGWVSINGEKEESSILKREVQRLEVSIKSAIENNLEPVVFMHYPPIYGSNYNYDILQVLYDYKIKKCFYGHLHGLSCSYAICGERDGIYFELVSSDFVKFTPKKVL